MFENQKKKKIGHHLPYLTHIAILQVSYSIEVRK